MSKVRGQSKIVGVSKRRLKNGKVRWRYYGSYQGKKFYSSCKYLSEGEAAYARRQHLEKLAAIGSVNMKFKDVVREKIKDLELNHTQLHASQTENYYQKAIDAWGDKIEIYDINRQMIQDLLNTEARRVKDMGKNNYSVNALRMALHSLFEFVIDRYELYEFRNPVARIKRFPIKERQKMIPEQWELDLVLEHLTDKQKELFMFILQTGCRCGEALRLKVKDLNFKDRLVTLWSRKARGTDMVYRRVPMPLIIDEMRDNLPANPNARVFNTWNRHPTFIYNTIQIINDRERKANLEKLSKGVWKPVRPFNFHHLRHRACQLWLEGGVNIYEVMQRLNHASIKTTMLYTQRLGFNKFTLIEGAEVDPWDNPNTDF